MYKTERERDQCIRQRERDYCIRQKERDQCACNDIRQRSEQET